MRVFAKVLLVFGLLMIFISLVLNKINQPNSPESAVGYLNIGIGIVMLLAATAYLALCEKKLAKKHHNTNRKDT